MDTTLTQSFFIALSIGVASGSIGAFIILKRMALVGDALSHVALPGIALALAYQVDPFWGVISFLLSAALLIWWLELYSRVPTDALVGLLFTASLAIGILTIPEPEALESLFGTFPALSSFELSIILGSAALASIAAFFFARQFLFGVVSKDLARVQGMGRGYDLLLLIIFSSVVALGIKLVGTLLMGALTIIPAAIARNVARSMKGYMILASVLGGAIAIAGVLMSRSLALRPGPVIILLGVGVFVLSLLPNASRKS